MSFLTIPWTSLRRIRSWTRQSLPSSTDRGSWGRWSGGSQANQILNGFPWLCLMLVECSSRSCFEMPQTSSAVLGIDSAMKGWQVGWLPPNPHSYIPSEKSSRIFRLGVHMPAIRGKKDISFRVSLCNLCKNKGLVQESTVPGLLAFKQLSYHVCRSRTVLSTSTVVLLIWIAGQQRRDGWLEISHYWTFFLVFFLSYFQAMQQLFPSTIQLW